MAETLGQTQEPNNLLEVSGVVAAILAGDVYGNINVGSGIECGQQIEFLKYETDFRLAEAGARRIREAGEIHSINDYFAAIGASESTDHIEQCGLDTS